MSEITLENKLSDLKDLASKMTDTNNGALDIIDALTPLNLIDDVFQSSDPGADISYIIKLKRTKTKLDSINQLAELTKEIIKILPSTGTAKLRAWVEKLKRVHYKITEQLKDEEYFQPVSNDIGARTIGKTYDVTFFRSSITEKLKSNNELNSIISYDKLNELFANQINNPVPVDEVYKIKLEEVLSDILSQLNDLLGDLVRLINYLYPISTSIDIDNDLIIIDPIPRINNKEDSKKPDVVINLRGDKKPEIAEQINNSVLCPCTK